MTASRIHRAPAMPPVALAALRRLETARPSELLALGAAWWRHWPKGYLPYETSDYALAAWRTFEEEERRRRGRDGNIYVELTARINRILVRHWGRVEAWPHDKVSERVRKQRRAILLAVQAHVIAEVLNGRVNKAAFAEYPQLTAPWRETFDRG